MPPEVKKYLSDMTEAAAAIETFCRGRVIADLSSDKFFRSAVYYQFVIIGEALSQLHKIDEATFARITEATRIVGFRNQIIHGYQVIRDAVTWQIIQEKLPVLQADLDSILK